MCMWGRIKIKIKLGFILFLCCLVYVGVYKNMYICNYYIGFFNDFKQGFGFWGDGDDDGDEYNKLVFFIFFCSLKGF